MTDDEGPRVAERPSPGEAAAAVEEALSAGLAVSLAGPSTVVEPGDGGSGARVVSERHVLVKPDGTTVVHGASGRAPVVSIDPAGSLEAGTVGGRLRLGAEGVKWVEFDVVELVVVLPLSDADGLAGRAEDGEPAVEPDPHSTLRERVLEDPDLVEPGFRPLATERETSAGPVDLFGRDADGRAVVVEVKAHRAGPAAVGQLDRYVSALRRDLHADAGVRGVLVAPSVTERARQLLADKGFDLRLLPAGDR